MAFIPVPDVVQANLQGTYLDNDWTNTLYFERSGGWSLLQMQSLGAALEAWWVAGLKPEVSDQCYLTNIHLRDISTGAGLVLDNPVSPNEQGNQGGEPMPGNVTFAISFRTAYAGKSFRGRNYIPGITNDQVNGNVIYPSYIGLWLAAYNDLLALATAEGCDWVVVSRYTNKLPRAIGIGTPVIVAIAVDASIDSMRTRLNRRGN